ncbi:MAG: radical SAM protein [Promethearchaeota archaeon]|nr:MAG: radical SAM protein [Candidatus Lokiarchaeota archaeon]
MEKEELISAIDKDLDQRPIMETDLEWIPEYIENVKEYLYVREEDKLLILRPMMVHHLNDVGTIILSKYLSGASNLEVIELLEEKYAIPRNKIMKDIYDFIADVRAVISGCPLFLEHEMVEEIPFKKKKVFYPILSELALTYRCNNECVFCYANSSPNIKNDELDKEQIIKIISIIGNDAKVPSISFTGGEPTVVKNLPEYIKFARKLGMRVNLITNGRHCSNINYAKKLVNAGLHSVQVSIEGSNSKVHDAITRRSGSFDETVQGILNLKSLGINVHTNTTINRMNLSDLLNLVDFIKDNLKNEYFSMNMVIYTGTSLADIKRVMVKYNEIGKYAKSIYYHAKKRNIRFIWYSPTCYKYFHPSSLNLDFKSCAACNGLLSVSPMGEVLPCSSFKTGVGNLLKEKFETIWKNKSAVYWRLKQYARPICKKCEYFSTCEGACPLYWDIIGLDELNKVLNKKMNIFQKLKYKIKRKIIAPQQGFNI